MPEENSGNEICKEPTSESSMQPPSQPPAYQAPPPQPGDSDPVNNQTTAAELEKIKVGESWLIVVGIAGLFINIVLGVIYYQQLTQMRIATQASKDAVHLANETLQYNASQFDRAMSQTIIQTHELIVSAQGAKEAADVGKSALMDVQRAFVFPEQKIDRVIDAQNQNALQFSIIWKNDSPTPTRNMITAIHGSAQIEPAEEPEFRDTWEQTPVRMFIAPHGQAVVEVDTLNEKSINTLISFKEVYYVWGVALYNDVFPKTPQHVTKFCYKFHFYRPDPSDPRTNMFFTQYENCRRHNCVDKECAAN